MRFRKTSITGKRVGLTGLLVFGLFVFATICWNVQIVHAEPSGTNEETVQDDGNPPDGSGAQQEEEQDGTNAQEEEESTPKPDEEPKATGDGCKSSLGALSWFVCPLIEKVADATDWMYGKIESILQVDPVVLKGDSAISQVWGYVRTLTNAVFIVFFLVVIYSQLTGYGISNYGIKKSLPKIVLVAVLINLSFLICSVAIDVSNVIGNGLRGLFASVEEAVLNATETPVNAGASMAETYSAISLGTALAVGGGSLAVEFGLIWMVIPTFLGAIVSVVAGLITITLRQAVVALLVMISPMAFVAYMLPNTEVWFQKWKNLFVQMLMFFPAFSLLFGASNLASFAIMSTAVANQDGFWLLLALGVQFFPLFYSVKLMKLSGTFLEGINAKIQGLAATPLATNRAWADSHRQLAAQKTLASGITPSARIVQFLSNRKVAREEEIGELAAYSKLRGQAYGVRRNYNSKGIPTAEGEAAYERQALSMRHTLDIERHKNNMNKGLGDLEAVKANASEAKKVRLGRLDIANITAADRLKIEAARGEKIDYENAKGFHRRMEDAMNIHFDDANRGKEQYKMHEMKDRDYARNQYAMISEMMEGDVQGIHYAVAAAAQGYDTQKKVVETKMQKYFELTPPTKDVEYRLGELTKLTQDELAKGKKAADNIDMILPGLRILNQRGDTDLVQKQMENILNKNIGGGIKLGTHASQALASFLMFDVKDNDPFLRRFGKYINLETARAYNENDRKVLDVTYDEYVKGYHDGEPDNGRYPGGRMYAKKGMRQLTEGTSLDNIERTALSNLDESLKRAYGYDDNDRDKEWDFKGYLKKREEIQTAFEPAFLSASLKWLSGSEQINSAVKFWTGYELKQKKDGNGKLVVDEDGNPEYELSAVWDDPKSGLKTHEKEELRKYYRRKTGDYFKDQTTGQILGMRTDYRDATMEHLVDMYLLENSEEGSADEKNAEFERERAEIQTRYSDKPSEEAKKLREKDLKRLKMDLAGRQLRKILGPTGKLGQIYRLRRSGITNNSKDWLRSWVGLDDEEAMFKEIEYYEEQRKKSQKNFASSNTDDNSSSTYRTYDESVREWFRNDLDRIWDDHKEASGDEFYNIANNALKRWFGEGETMIGKEFREYYELKVKSGTVEAYDLKTRLDDLLHNPDKYPDA